MPVIFICRQAELPFLTEGETILLLRDLVRRKVLREQIVPDVSTVSVSSLTIYFSLRIYNVLSLVPQRNNPR